MCRTHPTQCNALAVFAQNAQSHAFGNVIGSDRAVLQVNDVGYEQQPD